jgi:hypothetical protein
MKDTTRWDTFKADGDQILEKIKTLVHEGNVRRVIVEQDGRAVAEFPLTAGIVGIVLAPVLAAVAVLVAMLEDCTIKVERGETDAKHAKDSHAA